nr:hypothetical protein [Campylobacter sp.]
MKKCVFLCLITTLIFADKPNVEQCNLADSPLGQIIGKYESNNNYNIANALHPYRSLNLQLTQMTLAEIRSRQQRGTNILHATGRFQVIGVTLGDAVKTLGLNLSANYDKFMQDKIFTEYLVYTKRKGLGNYLFGSSNDVEKASLQVAQEWASMPVPPGYKTNKGAVSDGSSAYYGGDGVNPSKSKINYTTIKSALEKTKQQIQDGNCTADEQIEDENDNKADKDDTNIGKSVGGRIINPNFPNLTGRVDYTSVEACSQSTPASNAICNMANSQKSGNKIYEVENTTLKRTIEVEKENYVNQENRLFLQEKRNQLILNNQKISSEKEK